MHMPTVEQLLSQLFEGRGYRMVPDQTVEGASGTSYRVPLVAKASRDTVLVWFARDGPVTARDAEQMTAAVHDVGADLGVCAALAGADPAAVAAAAHGRVEIWSRGRLALEIGESMLHATADAHAAPPAPALATEGPAPAVQAPAAPPVPVARSQPRQFASLIQKAAMASDSPGGGDAVLVTGRRTESVAAPPGPLAYAWGGAPPTAARSYNPNATLMPGHATRQVDQWGNAVVPGQAAPAAPAPAAAAAPRAPAPAVVALPPPEVARPSEGQALAVRVDAERAAQAAAAQVGAPSGARLVLEPAIAFTWAWAGQIEAGKPPLETKGVMLVSAIDGSIREVTEPAWQDAPQGERGEGRVTAVDVYEKVKSRLVKLTTREVKVAREVAGEEVFEKKRVGPRSPDEANFEHHGQVWCPTWVVAGERGEVRVDAFSGELRA